MNDPAAGENYSETLAKRMAERREQEAQAALTAAVEQLREKDEELKRLKAENADIERVRHGLAKIYECNEKFHWKLADMIEPGIGGVSPLHFVEDGITKLRQQLAAANARLAAGVKFFTLSSDGSSGIEICKIHAGWNVYITHYGNFGPRENRLGLFESLDEAWSALVAANWLPAEPQQQGGG